MDLYESGFLMGLEMKSPGTVESVDLEEAKKLVWEKFMEGEKYMNQKGYKKSAEWWLVDHLIDKIVEAMIKNSNVEQLKNEIRELLKKYYLAREKLTERREL